MLIQFNGFSYNDATGVIVKNDEEYKLTKIQKKLFDYFLLHPKEVISKETLMQEVWGRIVTENTINKFISALRNIVEIDSSKPEIIVTHFGHGISFEGKLNNNLNKDTQQTTISSKKRYYFFALLLIIIFAIILRIVVMMPVPASSKDFSLDKQQHVLVLPTNYYDVEISQLQQQGLDELLKTTINQSNSAGQIVFNPAKLTNREAIEKYWHVDNELLILQAKVIKNGDIYESVVKLSKGATILKQTKSQNNNLNDLLNTHFTQIANLQNKNQELSPLIDNDFIQALGYKKVGNFSKAKELLSQLLVKQDKNHQARFELAKMYLHSKDYIQSMAHLETLKATSAYETIGSEIELTIAHINFINHEYEKLIDELKKYQASHTEISEVKKAKIKWQIGDAYLAFGDLQNAMKFFKQSILNINADFNPEVFAQSYYGQSMILLHDSNGQEVYNHFEKTFGYAKEAGDFEYQILALDEMAKIKLVSNQWEQGIKLKKQAIEIMELIDDKSKVAGGLGTLAAFLIQSGHYTEAKKANDRLGKIAQQVDDDTLYMSFLHYDSVLLMNAFKYEEARVQINKQLQLAQSSKNLGMQLDNAFLEFELRLAQKNTVNFKPEWDTRVAMVKQYGFDRYQVYLDFYLARYYKQINNTTESIEIFNKISEQAKANDDIKILVDAQNQLAEIYTNTNPQKALDILQNIEQFTPDANPYLELKAKALIEVGQKLEALNTLNQAKIVFHEAWKAENQLLLEQLQLEID